MSPIHGVLAGSVAMATLAAAVGLGVARAARRAPAVARHTYLGAALAASLAGPIALAVVRAADLRPIEVPWLAADTRAAPSAPHPSALRAVPQLASAPPVADAPAAAAAAAVPVARGSGGSYSPSPAGGVSWLEVVMAVWVAGVLYHAARAAHGAARLAHVVGRLRPMRDARFLTAARRVARQLGLARPPAITRTAALPVPAALGLLRPRIAIPEHLEHRLAEDEAYAVVLHEAAHIAHRHHWWASLALAARVVWWWHPLVRLAARRAGEVQEEVSDNEVLAGAADPRGYARCLLKIAEWTIAPPDPLPGCIALLRAGSAFDRRIRLIIDLERDVMTRSTVRHRWLAASFVAAIGCLCLLSPSRAADDPAPAPVPAAGSGSTAGASAGSGSGAAATAGGSGSAGTGTATASAPAATPTANELLAKRLEEHKITVDFVDTPLADVCEFVSQLADIAILIDPRTDIAAKPTTLRLQNVSVRTLLATIAKVHGIAHAQSCGVQVLTTADRVPGLPADAIAVPAALGEARRAVLDKRMTLSFADAPLSDIVAFIAEFGGQNIVLGEGIARDRPMSLKLSRSRIIDLITLVAALADAQATWVDEVLVVMPLTRPAR